MRKSFLRVIDWRVHQTLSLEAASTARSRPQPIETNESQSCQPGAILAMSQMSSPRDVITPLLRRWGHGETAALDELMPLIYKELHKLAKRHMNQQEADHTLQTTAVIHEAYLKLGGRSDKDW